jgi:hypothetical protein
MPTTVYIALLRMAKPYHSYYVNNTIPAGPSTARITKFKKDFNVHLDITNQGKIHYILGIHITHNQQPHTITLDQTAYVSSILSRFGMQDCHPVHTPLDVKDRFLSSQSPVTDTEQHDLASNFKGLDYLEGISSLIYACQTCIDIAHTGILA